VDFADTISVGDIEETIARLDRHIKQTYPKIKRVFVEAESRQTNSVDV
jgi:divalent metal cation (Fe/Co/Zn/Cd) transporter